MSRARNFHLPLPDDLYCRLKDEAGRTGMAATALVREALDSWLDKRQRQLVHDEIASYAREVAGTPDDLDEDLQEVSLEHLAPRAITAKTRRKK